MDASGRQSGGDPATAERPRDTSRAASVTTYSPERPEGETVNTFMYSRGLLSQLAYQRDIKRGCKEPRPTKGKNNPKMTPM